MSYPSQFGNIVMMCLGVALVVSGPVIVYRTIKGIVEKRKIDPKSDMHLISNGINLLIAVLFGIAGVLFIINNLRGNPLG